MLTHTPVYRTRRPASRGGFTLIELLVVIAILGLLISILLPSVTNAKRLAQRARCAANLHTTGRQLLLYANDPGNGKFPPSYMYPLDNDGNYSFTNQPKDHPYGYLHWSDFLLGEDMLADEQFTCPSMRNGGIPRTNPGPDPGDWEPGQVDQNGNPQPSAYTDGRLEDRQAPRMAYTGNAAVFPRNKFTTLLSGGFRINRLVGPSDMGESVILATEFIDDWRAITALKDGDKLCKSHRPVNPFVHLGTGTFEYQAPLNNYSFVYPDSEAIRPYNEIAGKPYVIEGQIGGGSYGGTELNAVGRHHVGGDTTMGGTANFLYVGGQVVAKSVLDTVQDRDWGDRYYSLTGESRILNYDLDD